MKKLIATLAIILAVAFLPRVGWRLGKAAPVAAPALVVDEVKVEPPPMSSADPPEETATIESRESTDRAEIVGRLRQLAASASSGTYGVYVYETDTDIGFGFNEEVSFRAASTVKAPVLAALYRELEAGTVDRGDRWTYLATDNETGTGSLQYGSIGSRHTVEELAEKMIKESDNVATNIIIRNLGWRKIKDLAVERGRTGIDMSSNQATPRAMTEMLLDIFRADVVTVESRREIFELMTDTEFEERLPRDLPEDVKVAHKIGTQVSAISDVGVVFFKDAPFIISVYSREIGDITAAEKTIAGFAKAVYDFELSRTGRE